MHIYTPFIHVSSFHLHLGIKYKSHSLLKEFSEVEQETGLKKQMLKRVHSLPENIGIT